MNKTKQRDGYRTFKTAGYGGKETLTFYPGPSMCMSITDGVALMHDDQGSWVVDYADLMEMARLATEARANFSSGEALTKKWDGER